MASYLVLLRHGQSVWNQENIFTGWVDVPLSPVGEEEAKNAQKALSGYHFDAVFTSTLKRAIDTAKIVLGLKKPAVFVSSDALNERHYGELQGKNKDEMREHYGEKQVQIWRRGFNERPPGGESLKDTCERVLPFFKEQILPRLILGETILVAAHGNSLRALVKFLENLSDEAIVGLEIPTGVPLVYHLDDQGRVLDKKILKVD
jgi:2,3-bisphosphoglycerate-dependent phosphoglycerate mutase